MYKELLKQHLNAKVGETLAEGVLDQLNQSLELLKVLRETYDMSTVDLSDTEVNLLHDHFVDLSIETAKIVLEQHEDVVSVSLKKDD